MWNICPHGFLYNGRENERLFRGWFTCRGSTFAMTEETQVSDSITRWSRSTYPSPFPPLSTVACLPGWKKVPLPRPTPKLMFCLRPQVGLSARPVHGHPYLSVCLCVSLRVCQCVCQCFYRSVSVTHCSWPNIIVSEWRVCDHIASVRQINSRSQVSSWL